MTYSQDNVRKSVSDGTIHKCPICGAVLSYVSGKCPYCGHEMRGVQASGTVQKLAAELREIDHSAYLLTSKANMKVSAITNFMIPNTKEDIIEFLIMASTGVRDTNHRKVSTSGTFSDTKISDAWFQKAEQAYSKAMIQFKNEPEFADIKRLYEECKSGNNSAAFQVEQDREETKKKNIKMIVFLVIFVVLWTILMFSSLE